MMKARLSNGDVIFGISKDNINALREDKPILIRNDEIGDITGNIYIIYANTNEALVRKLKKYISNKTKFTESEEPHGH